MTTRVTRADGLPEGVVYTDDGCDLHSACLSCPFPRCRYDVAGGLRTLHTERDAAIQRAYAGGESAQGIAGRSGLSRRRIFGIVSGQ